MSIDPKPRVPLWDAERDLGLGQPPECYGSNADQMLADQCSPHARIVVAEVARWRTDLPVSDLVIAGTYGDRFSPWQTADGNPPPGVTTATNTLASPTMPACNMILRGILVKVLVEPQHRLILGNFFDPGGVASMPGSPDVASHNDELRALGLAMGQSAPTPSEFLWGGPTWMVAYNFVQGYELDVLTDHQDSIIKQPLTSIARIQPFADAEAAGMAFMSNQDRVKVLNDRLLALGIPGQFMPEFFKRLGSITDGAGLNAGIFTPSREADGAMTMFGGIGVPQDKDDVNTKLFSTPMLWPAGLPLKMTFVVNDQAYQSEMQRWMSVTGGSGGTAGQDQNLPFSSVAGLSGLMPTTPAADAMLEQTLDLAPANVNQQTQTNRNLQKGGALVFQVEAIGVRIRNPKWEPIVAKAIKAGAITAPMGYGNMSYLFQ